jgi:hypothetical protein
MNVTLGQKTTSVQDDLHHPFLTTNTAARSWVWDGLSAAFGVGLRPGDAQAGRVHGPRSGLGFAEVPSAPADPSRSVRFVTRRPGAVQAVGGYSELLL